ncbi:MAG: VOC family protein [Gammaproteobacteria bacterium]|nr:VOC family protein [Gammaproteobacteria bacterium]
MLMGFHHAAISTPDLERFIDFYQRNFGCEVAWTFGWNAGIPEADALTDLENSAAKAAMLKLGDSFLEVFEFSSPVPRPRDGDRRVCDHGITHICLQVQDMHAEYERLQAAGMRFHSPPQAQDTGFVAYGRDLDGNVVELLEFTNAGE